MSFSGKVKDELAEHIGGARHCQIAELAAYVQFGAKIVADNGKSALQFDIENEAVLRKCFTLLKKTFNIVSSVDLEDEAKVWELIEGLKLVEGGVLRDLNGPVSGMLLKNSCCKRAYLRGVYLLAGSMSDPSKGYHLEIVCANELQANQIQDVLHSFELESKIILRKKYYVVYIKESTAIVDFLNICEAHVALMEFENLRILKEMRNTINRRVNCEAANITKTVNAAAKQIEEIEKIRDIYGFEKLPLNLRRMAEIRLENPDATLSELGELLDPPVGKSGVNHRLRRLSEIAQSI